VARVSGSASPLTGETHATTCTRRITRAARTTTGLPVSVVCAQRRESRVARHLSNRSPPRPAGRATTTRRRRSDVTPHLCAPIRFARARDVTRQWRWDLVGYQRVCYGNVSDRIRSDLSALVSSRRSPPGLVRPRAPRRARLPALRCPHRPAGRWSACGRWLTDGARRVASLRSPDGDALLLCVVCDATSYMST
jgi:hypothetical protein